MPPSTESEETDPSFACGAANVVSGDALRSGEDRRIEDGCRRRPGLVANCSALADTECVALRPISPHGFLRDSPLPQVQLQVSARRLLSPGAMWFGFVPRRLSLTSLLAAHRCPSAQIAPHCVSGFLHHRTQRVHTGQTGWPCKDGDISPSACKRVPLRRSPGQAPGRRRERFRLLQAPYAHNSPEILASPLPRRPASLVQRRCKHECEYKESTAARRAPVRAVRRTSSETRVKKAVHDDQSLVR